VFERFTHERSLFAICSRHITEWIDIDEVIDLLKLTEEPALAWSNDRSATPLESDGCQYSLLSPVCASGAPDKDDEYVVASGRVHTPRPFEMSPLLCGAKRSLNSTRNGTGVVFALDLSDFSCQVMSS
jgi:hypothetical protein